MQKSCQVSHLRNYDLLQITLFTYCKFKLYLFCWFSISDIQDRSICRSTTINESRRNLSEESQIITKFDPEMEAANFNIKECDIPLPPYSEVAILKKNFPVLLLKIYNCIAIFTSVCLISFSSLLFVLGEAESFFKAFIQF